MKNKENKRFIRWHKEPLTQIMLTNVQDLFAAARRSDKLSKSFRFYNLAEVLQN